MKITLSIVFMTIAFLCAITSFFMNLNKGFDACIWQLNCVVWCISYFIMHLRIERLLKIIKKLTN
jgi:hypothetical protein